MIVIIALLLLGAVFTFFPDLMELTIALLLMGGGIWVLTQNKRSEETGERSFTIAGIGITLTLIGIAFFVTLSGPETVYLATKTGESASNGDLPTLAFLAVCILAVGVFIGRATKKN